MKKEIIFEQLNHNYTYRPNDKQIRIRILLIPGGTGITKKDMKITNNAEIITAETTGDSITATGVTTQNRSTYPAIVIGQPKVPDENHFICNQGTR